MVATLKGRKSSSSTSRKATRHDDTLFGQDTVELLLALSEGPIKGLADGASSFYVGDVPLLDKASATPNISNFELRVLKGTNPADSIRLNLGGVGATKNVGLDLRAQNQQVVVQGDKTQIDYIDLRLVVQRLLAVSQQGGEFPTTFQFKVEVKRRSSSVWEIPFTNEPPPPTENTSGASNYRPGATTPGTIVNDAYRETYLQPDMPQPGKAAGAMWFNTTMPLWDPAIFDGTQWTIPANRTRTTRNGFDVWSWTDLDGATRSAWYSPEGRMPPPGSLARGDFLLTPASGEQVYTYNNTSWVGNLAWQTPTFAAPGVISITGLARSTYPKEYRIPVPRINEPYDVRVTRISIASTKDIFLDVMFESIQEVNKDAVSFPDLAVTWLTIKATDTFSQLPDFTGIYDGLVIPVPSNHVFDDVTQRCSFPGIWDGTFKMAYTTSPAWHAYNFIMNSRYGKNSYYPEVADKWDYYEFGKHCAENGFHFNEYITEPRSINELVNYIVGIAGGRYVDRGDGYSTVLWDADEQPAVAIFAPENTIEGAFTYSFTDVTERRNDFKVSFKNPELNYREDRLRVYDQNTIDVYGRNAEEFVAVGCRNAEEAVKRGRLRLATALTEKTIVNFKTNRIGRYLLPFQVILVADDQSFNVISGRVNSPETIPAGTSVLPLRDQIYLEAGISYSASFTISDGAGGVKIVTYPLTVTTPGQQTQLRLASALPHDLPEYAVFSIGAPKPFRITSITPADDDPDQIDITAIEVNRQKWAFVRGEVSLRDILAEQTGPLSKYVYPVTGAQIVPETTLDGHFNLVVKWQPSETKLIRGYRVYASLDGEPMQLIAEPSDTFHRISDARAATYLVTIVAVGFDGTTESPPVTVQYIVANETSLRSVTDPTNLRLVGEPESPIFRARDPRFTWDAASDPLIAAYRVEILNGQNAVVHGERVSGLEFTYTLDANKADNGGNALRQFTIRVRSIDAAGNYSQGAVLTVLHPAPIAINPILTSTTESIFADYTQPPGDFQGVLFWLSKTSGFNPVLTPPTYDGQANPVIVPAEIDTSYFVRMAAYDSYGKDPAQLNIGPEQVVKTNLFPIDVEAPDIPTGLTLTTKLVTTATGESYAEIEATWTAVTNDNLGFYEAEILEGDPLVPTSSWGRRQFVAGTKAAWTGLKPGVNYAVRVLSVNDTRGGYSGWSAIQQITAAKNLTKPGAVTGLTAVAAVESASLSWTNPSNADLAYVEIWYGTTAATTPTTLLTRVPVPLTFAVDSGLRAAGGSRKYWARPVNSSGTLGDFTASVTATSASITAAMIGNGIIDATKIATSLEVPRVVATLPATKTGQFVTLSSDGLLYRWDATAGAYTKFTPAANISGQITDAQIAALAATKVSGQLTDAQLAGIAAAKLVGKVVAAQIDTITNLQISTQLTSDQIAALDAAKVAGTLSDAQLAGISAGKLIGTVVASQIASIGATQITGTLTNAQIADLAATKITGQLTDTQIAALAATKISGQLTNAQLAAIDAAKVTGQLANTQIAGMDASKLIGTINTNQITAGAITAALFATGIQPTSIVTALPSATGYTGPRLVMNTTDGKIYRYNGTAFVASVPSTDITGTLTDAQIAGLSATKVTGQLTDTQIAALAATKISGTLTDAQLAAISASKVTGQLVSTQIADAAITAAKFANGIEPIEILGTLPTTGNFQGRMVFLTTDNKLYRHNGTAFVTSVAAADISGTVAASQIAALEASKITGQLTDAQVAALDATKLTGSIASARITAVAATAVTGTLTDAQIAGLSATKLAGQITGTQVSDGAISTAKLAAGAVTAGTIAAGAIVASKLAIGSAAENLCLNGDFEELDGAGRPYGWFIVDNQGTGNSYASLATAHTGRGMDVTKGSGGTNGVGVSGPLMRVEPGEVYELAAHFKTNVATAAGLYLRANWYNEAGTSLGYTDVYQEGAGTTTWTKRAGLVTAMAGATTARVHVYIYLNATATVLSVDNVRFRRASGATSIEDGAITTSKLVANAVTANEIAADAVTAAKILAGSITTAKLAASAVTVNEIAANAVVSAKIQAGAVQTAHMTAGSINADRLVAGSITTGLLAAGSVDAGKIAANAITSDKIVAGAITTALLAAGAVTANKLSIGSMASNLVPNGDFADDFATTWQYGGGAVGTNFVVETTSNAPIGQRVLRLDRGSATGPQLWVATGLIPAEMGQVYELETWVLGSSNTAGGLYLRVNFYDGNKAALGAYVDAFSNAGFNNGWAVFSGSVTMHASAKYTQVQVFHDSSSTAQHMWISGVSLKRAVGTTLIENGAITTDKLVANAVTAAKIAANTITAAQIAANTITAAQIAASTITGTQIAAGAITAREVAAASIVASKLAIGSAAENLVANGDFEELDANGKPALWYGADTTGSGGSYSSLPGGQSNRGLHVVKNAGGSNGYAAQSEVFRVEPGEAYELSMHILSNVATANGIYLRVNWYNEASTYLGNTDIYADGASTTAWVKKAGLVTAPSTATKARVLVYNWTSSTATGLGVDNVRFRKAASATYIEDGAIQTNKLAANAVTAAKIQAGTITANEIAGATITGSKIAGQTITAGNLAAATITANEIAGSTITGAKIAANTIQGSNLIAGTIAAREIAAGSIAASKLAIASNNMAYNPRLDQGTRGFVHAQGWVNHTGMYINNEWAPSGFKSLASNTPATVAQIGNSYTDFNAYQIDAAGTTRMYPATAGVTYEVSACVSAHRCAARLFIAWTRSDNTVISYVTGNQIVNNQHNSNYAYRDFGKSKAIGVAPAGTTGFYIILRAEAPYAGDGPYVFWSALMVAATITGATETSDYVDPGTTIIEGSSILTNSLHGNRITGNTITGDKIVANAITASHVAAGQISTGHIAAGAIDAGKIAANAVTAGKIDAGAITAREIAAGAIVASKLTLSDISNMIFNGDFPLGSTDGWESIAFGNGGIEYIGFGDPGGAYRLKSNMRDIAWTNRTAGQAGDVIYFSCMVHNQHAARANVFAQAIDGSGGGISFDVIAWTDAKGVWTRIEGRYTLPAGTSKFRFLLQCDRTAQDSQLATYWGRVEARRAASAQMIVDGAITTDRLAANSVVASKLAIASANLAYNPRGDQGLRGFTMGGTWPMGTSSMYLENAGVWAPSGFRPVALRNSGTAAAIGSTYGDVVHQRVLTDGSVANYPVNAGVTYEFSICMSVHRCKGTFYVAWCDPAGAVINYVQGSDTQNNQSGGATYKDFTKSTLIAVAPGNANQFFIIMRAHSIIGNDAYAFFSAMMYAPTFTGATQTSPYVDPGVTTIDGGNIVTNSLHGNRITAGTISADRIVAFSITSGQLAADSVTASQIAAGAVSTSELAANAITAEKINAGAITAREIAGSTITGDKIAANQISGGHIQGNTIQGGHIQGNQISGGHIIGRTITAGHIAVDTITASEIAAGAISTNELAANAVTAEKISAGVITSREIVAGSILASRLVLTDSSNMLKNGDFQNPVTNAASFDNWYAGPGGTTEVDTASGGDSGGYHRCKSNKRDCAYSEWVMVRPGDVINLSARVYNTNAERANLMMVWADGAGGNVGYPGVAFTDAKNTWTDISGQVTIPEGIHKFQVLLQVNKSGDGGNWSYWGKVQARKAANAMMIVDGAIVASKIQAGAVEADKIAANAITAAKISAGAVGTSQLAAGAITADKIGVGLSTGNLLYNSDMLNGMTGWGASWHSDGITPQDYGPDTYWCVPGTQSLRVHRTDTPANNAISDWTLRRRTTDGWDHRYPVQPGQRYEFSVYASTHRCKAQLVVTWYDANGNGITDSYSNVLEANYYKGLLDTWPRCGFVLTAPANAAYAYPIYRTIFTGQNDPYNFWLCPYFAVAQAGQQTLSAWSPASNTVIDGGFIATDSLHANRITAGTITGDKIAANTLSGGHIVGNTIVGGHIQGNSISTGHLQGQSITTEKLAVNSIEAKHMRISTRGVAPFQLDIQIRRSDQYLYWGGGYITYVDANNVAQAQYINAGGRNVSGHTSVGWIIGEASLRVYDDTNGSWTNQYGNPDYVPLAYYSGYGSGAGLIAYYGNTIIDGDRIATRSIKAEIIAVGAINADHIGAGQIKAGHIEAGAVTADKISAGTINTGLINIGNTNFQLDSNASNRRLILKDDNGQTRLVLGRISDVAYGDRVQPFGLALWDAAGTLIMNGGGFHGGALWARTITADRIASNVITANELSGGRLIVAEAQIGEATIGNLRLVNNAVSQVVNAYGSGNAAGVSLYVRGTGKVSIKAGRHGNPGQQVGTNMNTGNLRVYRNGAEIFAIPANFMFRWESSLSASYKYPLGHNIQITDEVGAGTYNYQITDDNNIGLGGVFIEVTELSK